MTKELTKGLLRATEKQNTNPFATISNGTNLTYAIYGLLAVGSAVGYEVKKISTVTNSTVIELGFLPETLRVSGANGSGTNVNLKTDLSNSLLLLADNSIIYG